MDRLPAEPFEDIQTEYRTKPDPDEPWRYVCPECKAQVSGNKSMVTYYCEKCEVWWRKEELLDKKHDFVDD